MTGEAQSLIARFLAQAERHPEAPALILPEETVSYAQLRARAGHIAAGLQAVLPCEGAEAPLVGLCLPRGADTVCAVFSILMAGGACLPIEPSYPAEARRRMAQATGLPLVITDATDFAGVVEAASVAVLSGKGARPRPAPAGPERLLHVLHTSGSTGQAKGVCSTHGQMLARLDWFWRAVPLGADDVCCHKTALHFVDASLEIYGTLLQGRPLLIVPETGSADGESFMRLLARHDVTRLSLVVSQLRSLLIAAPDLGQRLPRLKLWIVSGERLTRDLVAAFHSAVPGARLVNLYGCSEVPEISHCDIAPDGPFAVEAAAIGRVIDGTEIHIVDEDMRPVAPGQAGELLAGGPLQSAGYLNRPEETAARFIANSFGGPHRLYRTGDRVRLAPDGLLYHEGRADDQVKIRGHRVELAAVEAALKGCEPALQMVKAVVQEDPDLPENRSLVAFVTPATLDTAQLMARMREAAPAPLRPQRIIALDAMPTTASGKIDRRALSALAQAGPERGPESESLKATLRRLWRGVLMADDIRDTDNFFDIGGDSLRLAQLHRGLQGAFAGFRLSLAELLVYPTIAAQAAYLRRSTAPAPALRRGAAQPAGQEIAVIGMACRFPGAATPEAFWANLAAGADCVTDFTDAELEQPDTALRNHPDYVKAGAMLEDVAGFDPGFFGFSDRDAALIDPQHRVLLEVAWEAIERAGQAPGDGAGRIGVYAGCGANSYFLNRIARPPITEATLAEYHENLANDRNFLATRIAYKLGLIGPALTVQTACSTGLVVAHMACQALRAGECDLALAASVSIRTPQKTGYLYEEGMIRSPDGRCRAFDANAQGTLFGNGAGAVLLRPLAAALADGNLVLAVIRGSAVNNDGLDKIGYTAPGLAGQAAVITAAMEAAGAEPRSIGHVEAHGTGTRLGDPIEISALTRAYEALGWSASEGTQHCAIGTVKSNIGHLDETAGMAGLIKTVLMLQEGAIPASLHVETPNPAIDFAASPFRVSTRLQDWPEARLRAGVSAFGMGGTNCHMVLEAAPETASHPADADVAPSRALLVLSAPGEARLAALAARHAQALGQAPGLTEYCATAALGRRHFGHRRAVVAATAQEMLAALLAPAPEPHEGEPGRIAFVFSGQGAQYPGMARALHATCRPFRETLEHCAAILDPLLPRPLLPVLFGEDGALLSQTEFTQPALAAVEIALTVLWCNWGVQPDVVLGHSIGEYAAAHAAGVLSLEDTLQAVAARGRLMQALPAGGGMLATEMGADEAEAALRAHPGLCIAGINGPASTAVAGPRAALEALAQDLRGRGLRCKPLDVSHAFHSAAMEPMLAPFAQVMAGLSLRQPLIPLVSNVTGYSGADVTDPGYWARQARAPVRFAEGVATLRRHGAGTVVEIGPGTPLLGLIARIDEGLSLLPSLRKGQEDWAMLLGSLGRLYEQGRSIDWDGVYRGQHWRRRLIPTSAFQRRRCWVEREPERGGGPEQAGLIEALAAEAERPTAADPPRLYRPVWRSHTLPEVAPPRPGARWLILADRSGIGAALAQSAAAAGVTPLLLYQGDGFAALHENSWSLNPVNPLEMAAFWRLHGPAKRVMHLWALDAGGGMAEAQQAVLRSALAVLPWLGQDGPALTLATRGAQPQADDAAPPEALAQSVLWGLGRTLALEQPEGRVGLVDLDPAKDAADCAADLWRMAAAQDQLATRGGAVRAARLEPGGDMPPAPALRPDASYLVTGGLGALGLHSAEVLAGMGARHLVLTSRSSVTSEGQRERLEALRARGVTCHTPRADAADADAMQRLLEELRAHHPPLKGILHAAGVIAEEPTAQPDAARIAAVLGAKAAGAWVLHTLTEDMPLDLFILFSSASALLGLRGHAEYAGANAFLDALAAHRRARGLPALGITWGDWAGAGMAAGAGDGLAETGLGALLPAQARQALQCLTGIQGHHAVLRADWARFAEAFGAHQAFLAPCLAPQPPAAAPKAPAPGRLQDALQAADTAGRERLLREHLAVLACGIAGGGALDPAENLLALGFDSLMLITLRNRIRQTTGLDIKLPHILRGPSLDELAGEALTLLAGPGGAPPPAAAPKAGEAQPMATFIL